jgi:hypothetical protein
MNQSSKEETLHDKVLSWLETQGYDTEMKAAMALRSAGLDVLQSPYYQDPETKISREIDIVSRLTDQIGLITLYSVIECKKSQKPWIAFTSSSGLNRITSFSVTAKKTRHILSNRVTDMLKVDWFRKHNRIAHAITEAFTTKEDSTFKAGISATKASIALSQEEAFGKVGLNFFFPTVILDGKLFECYLDEKGNSILSEIDSVFLHFQIKFGEHHGASVHVVTLNYFNKYCEELKNTFDQLKQILKKERTDIAAKLGMNPDLVKD